MHAPLPTTIDHGALRTPLQRDVYSALVLDPARGWTVPELARVLRADEYDVGAALGRHLDAGVAVAAAAPAVGPRARGAVRFRLAPGAPGTDVDPFCGVLTPDGTPHRADALGTLLRFCSPRCLHRWRDELGAPLALRPPPQPGLHLVA
jgi:hypothetical protein